MSEQPANSARLAEHEFVTLNRLRNQTLAEQRGRHLCSIHACAVITLQAEYTQSTTAFDCLFLEPAKRQGCQSCYRSDPNKRDVQLVTMVKSKQN